MKEKFMSRFKRQRKDVDNWLYRHDPTKAQGKRSPGKSGKSLESPIATPSVKRTTRVQQNGTPSKGTKKAEFRVPFTALRVEGNILIIDIDIPK
jgi:hypothetical protein